MDAIEADVAAVGRIDVVPKILEVVCLTTGMGFAAVARVTEDRWVACAVRDHIGFGLDPGGELEIKSTLCDEVRGSRTPIVFNNATEHPDYCDHHTPRQYGLKSYISVPIISQGQVFGTLCAIDPDPRAVDTPQVRATFELFADLIGRYLEIETELSTARHAAELRDQFIAVLGHDLRNPLASIEGGTRLLLRTPLDEKAIKVVGLVQGSVRRMAGLIDNVLDFARGRLGGGFEIAPSQDADLKGALEQVLAETLTAHPEREIRADIAVDAPATCDPRRIAQLFSNLMSNALNHGAENQPIGVTAAVRDGFFTLTVSNHGSAIPVDARARLFQPFSRDAMGAHRQGLGLGLYIASEIAKAHGGALTVASDEAQTIFTFRMPVAA